MVFRRQSQLIKTAGLESKIMNVTPMKIFSYNKETPLRGLWDVQDFMRRFNYNAEDYYWQDVNDGRGHNHIVIWHQQSGVCINRLQLFSPNNDMERDLRFYDRAMVLNEWDADRVAKTMVSWGQLHIDDAEQFVIDQNARQIEIMNNAAFWYTKIYGKLIDPSQIAEHEEYAGLNDRNFPIFYQENKDFDNPTQNKQLYIKMRNVDGTDTSWFLYGTDKNDAILSACRIARRSASSRCEYPEVDTFDDLRRYCRSRGQHVHLYWEGSEIEPFMGYDDILWNADTDSKDSDWTHIKT